MELLVHHPTLFLGLLCGLALIAALVGGELPNRLKLTHTRLQVAVSFVAGLMLGLSLLGLLPHSAGILGSHGGAGAWVLGGFLVMFFLQRFVPFHHHDVAEGSPTERCGHTHSLAERSARSLSWVGLALGLSLHSIFDGLAMAAAVASDAHGHSGGALGLGTALAVILHKPFGALAITTLMAADDVAISWRHRVNAGFALVTPIGAMLFYLGAGHLVEQPMWLGGALAFCGGTFLCIACADLLPELQFHTHDRFKLSLALVGGLAIAALIVSFGHPEHEHGHEGEATSTRWHPSAACVTHLTRRGVRPGKGTTSQVVCHRGPSPNLVRTNRSAV